MSLTSDFVLEPRILFSGSKTDILSCSKLLLIVLLLSLAFSSQVFALFDSGTALAQGEKEIDVCINPLKDFPGGQSFLFGHYGLGNQYELHGYISKWGAINDGPIVLDEYYFGVLKQWATIGQWDLATSVGLRQYHNSNFSLIGPGILYTFNVNTKVRLAGHLQYIGDILPDQVVNYGIGYTSEIGFYYLLTPGCEFAIGCFTNSRGQPRPIYTFNFYF